MVEERTNNPTSRDREEAKNSSCHVTINQEYHHAFRTKSYLDFFAQAQDLRVNDPKAPNNNRNATATMQETLIQPNQHLIPSLLNHSPPSSDLFLLILRCFDTSAQASRICAKLLNNISQSHSNYQLIQSALDSFSIDHYNLAISGLDSYSLLKNPFSEYPNTDDFNFICHQFSSILSSLNSKRNNKKVSTRMKLMFKSKSSVKKAREQLDVAAKGTYIVSRDMDTMSRIVGSLSEEVRHKKEMIRYCLEKRNNNTNFKTGERARVEEVVKELMKERNGFKRQMEELEEHVCLCLVTINRARVLLIKEMAKP